jgi:predicted unusual protein kinase regulating ubiquinone biosynthesis (AarF/ABC1/UbiB family)
VTGTERVLISEWVNGTPVARIARSGSAADRDRVGLLLTRLLLSSPPRVGRLHADPHPGNFRLLDDGRLAVVDFGSSLPMPGGWSPRLARLLRAGRDHDSTSLLQVATAAGLVRDGDMRAEALLTLVDPLLEPLRKETFSFTRQWLRSQTLRFSDPRSTLSRTQRKLRVPVHYLLVQRVMAGTTGVLCLLEARVPLRDEAAAWIPDLGATSG